jgi:hypothetical protein
VIIALRSEVEYEKQRCASVVENQYILQWLTWSIARVLMLRDTRVADYEAANFTVSSARSSTGKPLACRRIASSSRTVHNPFYLLPGATCSAASALLRRRLSGSPSAQTGGAGCGWR